MKKIQGFNTFQINESKELFTEQKVRKQLKELLFEDQDDEDIESLFLNIKDYGFEVIITRVVYDWEAPGRTLSFEEIGKTLNEGDYPTWRITIGGPFNDHVEDLIFISNEFKKIKKRCKKFRVANMGINHLISDRTDKYLKVEVLVTLKSDVNMTKFKKSLEGFRDALLLGIYQNHLNKIPSFFAGEKGLTKLQRIIGVKKNISRAGLDDYVKSKLKRSIFDLDNNRMIFTYDVDNINTIKESILHVKKYFNTKSSKFNKDYVWFDSHFFEVIIHLKQKNAYDFKFKDDETLAFEVSFDNQALKTGINKQGEFVHTNYNYVEEIQKLIDDLK
jgi:hypothetical protein